MEQYIRLGLHIWIGYVLNQIGFQWIITYVGQLQMRNEKRSCEFFSPVQVRFQCQIHTADWTLLRTLYQNLTRLYVNPA